VFSCINFYRFSYIINHCFDFLSKPITPPKYITLCSVNDMKLLSVSLHYTCSWVGHCHYCVPCVCVCVCVCARAPRRQAVSILLLLFYNKLFVIHLLIVWHSPPLLLYIPADVARVDNGTLLRKHKLMNRDTDDETVLSLYWHTMYLQCSFPYFIDSFTLKRREISMAKWHTLNNL